MPELDLGNPSQEDYEADHRTLLGQISRLEARIATLQSQLQRTTPQTVTSAAAAAVTASSGSTSTSGGSTSYPNITVTLPAWATVNGTGATNTQSGSAPQFTIALPVFGPSGGGHAAGIVPDPGSSTGSTHFLCEDGTWSVPPTGGGGTTTLYNVIDGFQLAWASNTTLTLTSGAAYVDSAAAMVAKTTGQTVTVAGGSPTASTWYYVYLPTSGTAYASTTTPAVNSAGRWEASATAAGATIHDRCLGAVYSDASSHLMNFLHCRASDTYRYNVDIYGNPFHIINGVGSSGVTTATVFGPAHLIGVAILVQNFGGSNEALSWGNSVVTPSNSTLQPHGVSGYVHNPSYSAHMDPLVPIPDHTTFKLNKSASGNTDVFCLGWTGPGA